MTFLWLGKDSDMNLSPVTVTLLRYIHQNPLKAGIVKNIKDYEYSSWCEYDGEVEPVFRICDTETVLRRIPFTDLEAWVNEPLPDDAHFLDNDDEKPKFRLSDDQVWQQIIKIAGVTCSSDFQKLVTMFADGNTKLPIGDSP